MSRLHNNANVLSVGARVVAPTLAIEIADVWLTTEFQAERHQRRIKQIEEIESQQLSGGPPEPDIFATWTRGHSIERRCSDVRRTQP